MKHNVLVIGSGGREHAIGWKLLQSPQVARLYFAPGNAGTATIGENVIIDPTNARALIAFAKSKRIQLTVVGPESGLAVGLVDKFTKAGLTIFGPTRRASRLETSKVWATKFMARHGLPHPQSEVFTGVSKAMAYAQRLNGKCVVKADGLCQGKGVFVCHTITEVKKAIQTIMTDRAFGVAGKHVVIQELLVGVEVSVMAFCDGTRAVPLVAAQDYKRAHENNQGPNTGGMGSIAPARSRYSIIRNIHALLASTVSAMKQEGFPYRGVLYAGIMLVGDQPYILEFNCRFGDPETQAQLPLLASDLYPVLYACSATTLKPTMVRWHKKAAVCVVAASHGYPGLYKTGKAIVGIETVVKKKNVLVFHAGTVMHQGVVQTNGGRVLGVVGVDRSIAAARKRAYAGLRLLSFDGMLARGDIGL